MQQPTDSSTYSGSENIIVPHSRLSPVKLFQVFVIARYGTLSRRNKCDRRRVPVQTLNRIRSVVHQNSRCCIGLPNFLLSFLSNRRLNSSGTQCCEPTLAPLISSLVMEFSSGQILSKTHHAIVKRCLWQYIRICSLSLTLSTWQISTSILICGSLLALQGASTLIRGMIFFKSESSCCKAGRCRVAPENPASL